jgi:hypothetical protein
MICVHEIGIGLDERYQVANGVIISIELEKCYKIFNLGVDLIIRHIYLLLHGFDDKLQTIAGDAIVKTGVFLIFLNEIGEKLGLRILNCSFIGVIDANDVVGVDV